MHNGQETSKKLHVRWGWGMGMGATRLQLKRLPKDFLGVGWDEGFRVFRA